MTSTATASRGRASGNKLLAVPFVVGYKRGSMNSNDKREVIPAVSTPAIPGPVAATVPSSGVPLEVLRRYSSAKPLRRAAPPPPKAGKISS
jgi:hypothetical protein